MDYFTWSLDCYHNDIVISQAAARQASSVSQRSLSREVRKYPENEQRQSPEDCGACEESKDTGEGKHGEMETTSTSTGDACQSGQASLLERYQHIRTMYNGLGASLIGTTVSQGVYFYFYSSLKSVAMRRRQMKNRASNGGMEQNVAESLIIASLAGMANVLLTNPIWIVATRMQTYRNNSLVKGREKDPKLKEGRVIESCKAPSTLSIIASIYHDYGIRGFWNGVRASLIMVINPTIQYAIYEWLMAARLAKKKRPSSLQVFLTSAVAKAGATILTYPMLTVKTRMMSARKHDTDLQYSGVFDAVAQIMNREGLRGYYRGMSTKITQSILGAAILLVCKEKITDITRNLIQRTI